MHIIMNKFNITHLGSYNSLCWFEPRLPNNMEKVSSPQQNFEEEGFEIERHLSMCNKM